ncbi:LapA family protein [Pseudomonas sp. A-1]|nr:LapA family protein [Pseudomonas sp. A-1]
MASSFPTSSRARSCATGSTSRADPAGEALPLPVRGVPMYWIKRILVAVAALLVAAITLVFILENQSHARLQFMTLQSPELPVAFFVALAFIAGGLAGVLLSLYLRARLKFALARNRSELGRCRKELDRLREQLASKDA